MNADLVAVVLVVLGAPAATIFPVVYGLSGPWWRTLLGRALMTSSTGLALLFDITLLYKAFGDNYALRDVVRLSVYFLVVCGVWMQLYALLAAKWQAHRVARSEP